MGKSLRIKCGSCNDWFESPIQMDEASFKSARMSNNSMQCGYCGKMNRVNKEQMKFM